MINQKLIAKYANQLGAVVVLTGSGLSLGLSTYFELLPCTLCYWQRIFLYPLVSVYLAAIWRKDDKTYLYSLPLASLGALFAGYHYALQMGWISLAASCVSGVSCTDTYVEFAGFFTIPFGAFLTFAAVVGLSLVQLRTKVKPNSQSFFEQLKPVLAVSLGLAAVAVVALQLYLG